MTATPSQRNIGPQTAKAHPAGVTRVWYFEESSAFVGPKTPVKDTYVTAAFNTNTNKFSQ